MKRLLLIGTLLLSATTAQADLLIEPYLGFGISSGENGASPKTEYSQNSPFIGGRLGYQVIGLMAGLDYTKGMEGDFERKTNGSTSKADVDQQTLGLFVGYNLPIMLRAWVSYYLSSKLEFQSSSAVGDQYKGGGYGVGVGFTGLPLVSLNLEYRMLSFDEYKNASTGNTSSLSGNSEIDYNQLMLSVSIPLTL